MLGIINTNIKGVKEKMRRSKFNSIVLCLFVILTMLFLFACEEDHEHTFDDSWSSDEIYHYHEASCEHKTEVSNKEKHSWDGGRVTTPASHTKKGEKVITCIVCKKSVKQEIDVINDHTFDQEIVDEKYLKASATCTSKAVYYKSCLCGEKGTDTFEYGKPLEHSWHSATYEWSSDYNTCTAIRICKNDSNHKEIETVNSKAIILQNQSCLDKELTEYVVVFTNSFFERQVKTNIETKDALGHKYVFEGFNWYSDHSYDASIICDGCKDEKKVDCDVTYEIVKEASCVLEGSAVYKAKVSIDGIEYESSNTVVLPIDPLKHSFVKIDKLLPTCLEYGHESGEECVLCGHKEGGELIPALGHHFDQEIVDEKYLKASATCSAKAVYYKSCLCGEKGTDTFEYGKPLEHNWHSATYEWSSDYNTCTAIRICKNDSNHKEIETVNSKAIILQNQSCLDKELTEYVVVFTNSFFERQVKTNIETKDALGHKYSNDYKRYDGNHHYIACDNCHENKIEECKFSSDLKYDELNHYNECEFCGNRINVNTHSYDNGKCKDCGQVDPNPCIHDYVDGFDEASHYKICKHCKKIDEETIYNHVYDKEVSSLEYLKSGATCTSKAVYYHSCVCGAKGSSTFASGEILGHDFGEPTWNWVLEGSTYKAVAKFVCDRDESHIDNVNATVTSNITLVPTCVATGSKTYYANVVRDGITYTDSFVLEIGIDHNNHLLVDDERLEPTCLVSGHKAGHHCANCDYTDGNEIIPALGHDYSGVFEASDLTHHSHKCNRCDEIETLQCEFSNTYSYDEYQHFYVCNVCGNKKDAQDHSYVDDICSSCGQKNPNACAHTYIDSCNNNYHYKECSLCGKIDELSKEAHVFNQLISENVYLKHSATCLTKAVYYKTCICGYIGTETFEFGNALGHDYTNVNWSTLVPATCTENGKEYKDCNRCGESGRITKELEASGHNFDEDNYQWVWIKTSEGYEAYYRLICLNDNEHYSDTACVVEKTSVESTCLTEGVITFTAKVIVNSITITDTKKVTIDLNHENHESDELNYIDNGNGTHTVYYSCCDVEKETTSHTPNEEDGDCTTEIVCTKCNAVTKEAEGNHSYGEWTYVDGDKHSHNCTHVNCNASETESHYGGNTTCNKKAVCEGCNQAYGSLLPHTFLDDGADEVYHYCCLEGCSGMEAHEFDSNNICTICNYELSSTANLLFTLLDNNTYKVSKGTATALDVVIPSSYKGLSVTQIDNRGFYGYSMTSVVIPNSIKVIGNEAFKNTNLESVMLPLELSDLGIDVFDTETKVFSKKEFKDFTCTDDVNLYYYAPINPQIDGKYWYYDNNEVTIWTKCELVGHTISGGFTSITENTHTYYCNECRESITESHYDYTEIVNNTYLKTAATCTEEATYYYVCRCNSRSFGTYNAGEALGHDFSSYVEIQEMTCTDDQILERVCKREGCTHSEQEINKTLGHYFIDTKWFSNNDGHYHKCENCDETTEVIKHSADNGEGIVQTAATCTEEGQLLCVCNVCNDDFTITIEKTEHSYTEWGYDDENHYHICSECGDALDGANSHILEDNVLDSMLIHDATCTNKAIYYKSCECGYFRENSDQVFEYGEILGHDWDELNLEWNWSEDGSSSTVTYTCNRDGEHHDTVYASISVKSVVPSTCTINGTKTYVGEITRNSITITDEYEVELPLDQSNHNIDEYYHSEEGELYHYHICLDCGEKIESSNQPHNWDEGEETGATCTQYGTIEFTCLDCGLTYTNKTAMADHTISEDYDYNKDYHYHYCSECNEMISSSKEIHVWNSGTITQDPTCYSHGIKTYECSICNATKEEEIDMISHTYENMYYYYDELYHYQKCDSCDYYDVLTLASHDYLDGYCVICGQPDPNSCAHEHYESAWDADNHFMICNNCKKIKNESIEAHILVKSSEIPSTCSSFGEIIYICSCGYELIEKVDKKPHSIVEDYWEVSNDNHWHVCSQCYEIVDSSVEAHNWLNAEGEVILLPSCSEEGERLFVCSVCDYEKYVKIPMLEHNRNEELEANEYMHYHTCSVCNTIVDYEYHNFSENWSKDLAHHWHECTECSYVEDEKTEHEFNQEIIDNQYLKQDATCLSKALYYYSCQCGQVGTETFEIGNPLGHDYSDVSWTIFRQPICNELGVRYKDCTRCGEEGRELEDIPMISHTFEVTYTKNEVEHWHECSVCHAKEDEPVAHVFDQEVIDNMFLISKEVRCGGFATYYYSCICGEKGYTSFTYGDSISHSFTNAEKVDECYHYCNSCNEKEAHNFGLDDVCDECGYMATYTLGLSYGYYAEGTVELIGLGSNSYKKKIVIPSEYDGKKVVAIDSYTFQLNTNVEEIVLPNTLYNIEGSSFNGCTKLNKINLENVITIGNGAFKNCSSLVDVVLSSRLDKVSSKLFEGLTGLTSIVIPDGVTVIEDYAFKGCVNLVNISFPSSLTKIGYGAFIGCGFESFTIPSSIDKINGELFQNCTNLRNVIIPEGVKTIGDDAFNGCTSLQTIHLPSTLTTLGGSYGRVFKDCTSLYSVLFGEGTTITKIPNHCFNGCTSLVAISIPNSVTTIGEYVFKGCTGLEEVAIGNCVASIKKQAFYDCRKLRSISIPNSVTAIGDSSFYNCTSLESVILSNSLTELTSALFYGASSLKSIIIPSGITTIAGNALPSKIEKIFYLGSLESLTYDNLVSIEKLYCYSETEPVGSEKLWRYVGGIPLVWDTCALGNHVYDQNVKNIVYLKTPATCESSAVYYRSCVCGEKGGEEDVFETGLPLDHNLKTVYEFINDYQNCTATMICVICGEEVDTETVETSLQIIYHQSCEHEEITVFSAVFENAVFGEHKSGYIKTKNAKGHSYVQESIVPKYLKSKADCVNPDIYYLSCECGHFEKDENNTFTSGEAKGHELVSWNSEYYKKFDATCTSPAIYYKGCFNCDFISEETFEYGKALGHSGEWNVISAATCTEDGFKTRTCSVCSEEESMAIPALKHMFSEWTVVQEATCELNGYYTRSCQRSGCLEVETREIPALGHHMTEYNEVIPVTCVSPGVSERHCMNSSCSHQEVKTVNAKGHAWTSTANITEWSCMHDLVREQTCSTCGAKKQVVIPAKEHLYAYSWSKDEYYHYHVATCGCSIIKDKEPHSFVGNTCTICGYKKTSETPIEMPAISPNLSYTDEGTYVSVKIYDKAVSDVITIPGTYNDKPVYLAGISEANTKRDLVTSVYIQDGVEKILDDAFKGCINLAYVYIPDSVTEIGSNAFNGCVNLGIVRMGNNVTKINAHAFSNCSKLSNIKMPKMIHTISSFAFSNCNITTLEFPNTLININESAFIGCDELISVVFEPRKNNDNTIRVIQEKAFADCTNLESIILPDGLWTLEQQTFKNCVNLKRVFLNEHLQTIGNNAFEGCTSLKDIFIPNIVETIGVEAFKGATSLTDVKFGNNVSVISERAFYDCDLSTVIIPKATVSIGEGAFYGNNSISVVSINSSIGSSSCFDDNSITIFNGSWSSLKQLGNQKTSLKKVSINGSIGEDIANLFKGYTELEIVDLNNVVRLPNSIFSGCTSLKVLSFDGSIISESAFEGCTNLIVVYLPKKVDISNNSFKGCINLETVVISDYRSTFTASSFVNCKIKYAIIPNSYKSNIDNTYLLAASYKAASGTVLEIFD